MTWQIVRLLVLVSLAVLLAGLVLAPAPALADDGLHHAALVVRDRAGRVTYAWVPFSEAEIDGIELLEQSGIPVVTVGFGALGEGVCAIGGEGCDLTECRRNVCQGPAADAPYWQFFRQDPNDPAIWTWQMLGASATDVHDGDVFGWSWTAGDPGLPALSATEIASTAGVTNDESTEPAVRTLLPEGVAAVTSRPAPDAQTTAIAAGIVSAIGVSAIALAYRRRSLNGRSYG